MDLVPEELDFAALRQIVVTYFDENELRDMCFDLGVDYESLPGSGKGGKARELLAYARRCGRVIDLVTRCYNLRPHAEWHLVHLTLSPSKHIVAFTEPTILLVDDRLAQSDFLFQYLHEMFQGTAHVHLVRDPLDGKAIIAVGSNVIGCIVDVVFSNSDHPSMLAGITLIELAISRHIPVVVITNHKMRDLGIVLTEYDVIGLNRERVLNKPLVTRDYDTFSQHVTRFILGPREEQR